MSATEARDLDILVVGEINPDVVVLDPDLSPAFGQIERQVAEVRLTIGSSSAITACGAAKLGLRVAIVGVVGDDDLGRYVVAGLADRGVDVGAVRVDPSQRTGASVILSRGDDRAILTAEGAIGAVTADDVPTALLDRARHLHVGSWFLQRSLWPDAARLLATAREAGLTTSIDPNWDPAEQWDSGLLAVLPYVDVLLPNATEAARIAGVANGAEPGTAGVALARLAGGGAAGSPASGVLVVVKAGAEGAVAATASGLVASTKRYPIEVVDTTGAGDSFDAGFLDAWLSGLPVAEALRRAAICGALSTRAVGGTEAQATRADVDRALAAWAA